MQRPNSYITAGLLFLAVFCQFSLRAQTGPGGSPTIGIPPSALPPSAQNRGLIRTPNPIDTSSNLTVTGNIRGGKYFHGTIPYRDTTAFGEALPSASLDSFMRDSAGTEDISSFTSRYNPYYSPTQTVTTVTPGSSNVTRPPTTNIGSYTAKTPASGTSLPSYNTAPETGYKVFLKESRPMSMTLQELEAQISSEINTSPQNEKSTLLQYQTSAEQFNYNSAGQVNNSTPDFHKKPIIKNAPWLSLIESKSSEDTQAQDSETSAQQNEFSLDEQRPDTSYSEQSEQWLPDKPPSEEELNVYEQMKTQLDELQKKIDLALAEGKNEEQIENIIGSWPRVSGTTTDHGHNIPQEQQLPPQGFYAPKAVEVDPSITKKAKDILGPYHTPASFSESKFNKHMEAAEYYLEQGRYYRAADAYTLASVYRPDNPLAYAGKSHALFASGEYMSSALFLSRTLDMFPEYAKLKVDLQAMLGGSEKLNARIADVEEWLSRSDAVELHFLLAYVYFQTNKPDLAQKAINAAYQKAPDEPAVVTLKKAIEDSM